MSVSLRSPFRRRSTYVLAAVGMSAATILGACNGGADDLTETPRRSSPATTGSVEVPETGLDNDGAATTTKVDEPVTARHLEQAEAVAECAADEGVFVEVANGGGVQWKAPDGQEEIYRKVVRQCNDKVAERFGITTGEEPTRQDMEEWYKALLWTYECMKDHGYHTSEPPSVDVYVDSGGAVWHPYTAIMTGDGGAMGPGIAFNDENFRELENTCPQDLNYLIDVLGVLEDS